MVLSGTKERLMRRFPCLAADYKALAKVLIENSLLRLEMPGFQRTQGGFATPALPESRS